MSPCAGWPPGPSPLPLCSEVCLLAPTPQQPHVPLPRPLSSPTSPLPHPPAAPQQPHVPTAPAPTRLPFLPGRHRWPGSWALPLLGLLRRVRQGTTLREVAPGTTRNTGKKDNRNDALVRLLPLGHGAYVPSDPGLGFPLTPGLPLQSGAFLRLQLLALVLACPWRMLEEETLPRCPAQATCQPSHQSFSPAWPHGMCLAAGSGIRQGQGAERHMGGPRARHPSAAAVGCSPGGSRDEAAVPG